MHCAVQTVNVTIISYKPLSDLNFARYTQHYGSCMPSSPLESISPCFYITPINKRYVLNSEPHSVTTNTYSLASSRKKLANIPETVKNIEQLNNNAAKWQYGSHKRRGDWTGKPFTLGYLTGNQVGFNQQLRPLRKRKK